MDCSGFGVFWRPIFRRKCNTPELRARRGKFKADFGFVASNRAKKHDVTFLLFRCPRVLEMDFCSADYAGLQQNECSVGVDRKCFRFFFKVCALRV